MDFHIMETLGTKNNDQNLLDAAAAQKERFYPDGDSADPKVVALDNVFAIMPNGDGYAGFSKMFALQSGDGVRWDGLGVPNPDVKRSEYVVAYMSLAARQQVLGILQGPGANGGGGICNNDPDSSPGDDPYLCSEDNINEIATAHCSIAANGKPSDDLDAFRSGDYANIPSGPCGGSCPSECGCDAMNNCVPIWLAADGTGGATGTGGSGASGMGGTGGRGAGVGGIGGTATGAGGSSAAGNNADADTEGGCSCRAAGTGSDGNPVGRLAALLFAAVVLARMRPEGRLSRKCDQLRRSA
jgi:MYXO-CTERM domain-containing protein